MTKKEMFAEIATLCADREDVVEFCNREIELLGRKHGSSKPTKTQIENEKIKEAILEVLAGADEEKMSLKEINTALGGEYSPQKLSALLRLLKDAGKVEKTYEKKVAYFSLA